MHIAITTMLLLATGTDAVDRERVRKSIELPRISMMFGISLNSAGQIIVPDWNALLPAEIVALEKTLRGPADDAPRYRTLSGLYFRAGDKERGNAALTKAATLYRGQLASRPRDGFLLAHYADCLPLDTQQQKDEAEKLLRQAVQLSPAEWECWVLLAGSQLDKAYDVLGGKPSAVDPNPLATLERLAREGKITPELGRKAQEYQAEAMRCLDRAVSVAPREPAAYLARAGACLTRNFLLGIIRTGPGRDALAATVRATWADCCPDLWQATALKPNDAAVVGIAVVYDLLASVCADQEKGVAVWKAKETVQRGLAQLERLAAGAEPNSAAVASEILGLLCLKSDDLANMEKHLARALRLNPNLEQASDMRFGILMIQNRHDELVAALTERLKYRDCSRTRFLLAKAYDTARQPLEAVRVLGQALEREPDNALCNLSLAALLMRDGGDLKRAEFFLGRALQTIRKHPVEEELMCYNALLISFLALNGQMDQAREQLRQLTPECKRNSQVQALLEILEPGLATPPSPIPRR
jgi:tetratricopeptide (TPR) repeat protein